MVIYVQEDIENSNSKNRVLKAIYTPAFNILENESEKSSLVAMIKLNKASRNVTVSLSVFSPATSICKV